MGVRERRERERTEVREKILDAALEFFAAEGVEGVTMRALADAIEYSPPVIYSHFRDKDALIRELCDRALRDLSEAFVKIGQIDDPIERLRKVGQVYIDFALENPSHFRFSFLTEHATAMDDPDDPRRNDPQQNAYAFLRETIAQGIAAGRFRPEFNDAEEMAQMCWGAAHGVVAIRNVKHGDGWVEWRDTRTTAYRLLDALIAGMTAEPSARLTSKQRISPRASRLSKKS